MTSSATAHTIYISDLLTSHDLPLPVILDIETEGAWDLNLNICWICRAKNEKKIDII